MSFKGQGKNGTNEYKHSMQNPMHKYLYYEKH